ncbi:MAG: thioesterase domain-containing protein [Planctomycetota bacterium]
MTQSALLESSPDNRRSAKPSTRPGARTGDVQPIVPLHESGTRPPLYLLPSADGSLSETRRLVRELGSDRPVLAFQPPTWPKEDPLTLPMMAQHYLLELDKRHPGGPVHLAGFGLGGPVAFEIARRLSADDRAASLFLIDTWTPTGSVPTPHSLLRGALHFAVNLPGWAIGNLQHHGIRLPLEWLFQLCSPSHRHHLRGLKPDDIQLALRQVKAWRQYHPVKTELPATLFRSRISPLFRGVTPDTGWRTILSDLEIRTLPGLPGRLLESTWVRPLAIQLRTLLSQHDRM